MKHKKLYPTLFLIGSILIAVQAQHPIRLEQAVDLTLKNSKQLQLQQAKTEEAYAALREAEERKLPNASASASYLRLSSANVDLKIKSTNSGGGTASPPPSISQAMYGLINASLPIYAGGRINHGIESARLLAEATKLDAADQKEKIVQTTVEAYVNLCKARAAIRLVQENLNEAKQRVTDLSNLEKNGLLARNDLMKAELQQTNTEYTLVDAENNWHIANVNMNIMMGLPDSTVLSPDTSQLSQQINLKAIEDYLQSARIGRHDVAGLDLRKKAAEIGVKSVEAEKYPAIQLTGGYAALNIPKFVSVTNALNLGLGVSYNIASLWKLKSKLDQANAHVHQMAATEAMLDDNIKFQINKTYFNVLSAQKKVEVYTKAIDQASENYRIVHNKFNNNLATTTEMLDADVALLQSRLAQTFMRADALLAYYQLLQTAGVDLQDFLKTNSK
jgi:outer membrane protein TolC